MKESLSHQRCMEFFKDPDYIYECEDCGHKSNEWGELDHLVEINADGEEAHQVLCPKCGSYEYL